MIDDPNRPAWSGEFLHRHAGARRRHHRAAADLRLFPRRAALAFVAPVTFVYTLAIAFLMVSRLPVFSGKRVGKRVAPEMVLPVFVCVVLFFALLIAYPWWVLTIGTVLYLASLPFGWISYRESRAQGRGRERWRPAEQEPAPAPDVLRAARASPSRRADPERPARLN